LSQRSQIDAGYPAADNAKIPAGCDMNGESEQNNLAPPQGDLARAQALIKSGDDAAAEAILAQMVASGNVPLRARVLRARALRRLGRIEDAVQEGRSSLEMDPTSSAARVELARALMSAGKNEEAQGLLSAVSESGSAGAEVWSLLADAHSALGSHARAIEAASTAVGLEPELPRYLATKVDVLLAAEDAESAVSAATELTTKFPEYAPGVILLARARALRSRGFLRLNRIDDALRDAQAAVTATPGRLTGRLELARAQLKADRAAEARDLLSGLCAQFPGEAFGWSLLADAHRALDQPDQAQAAIDRAIELDPGAPAHQLKKILLSTEQGNLDDAEHRVGDLLPRMPDHVPLLILALTINSKRHRWDDAARIAERICTLAPDERRHRYRWAEALFAGNRFAECLEVAGQPNDERLEDTDLAVRFASLRARAHHVLGNMDKAVENYLAVLKINPDDELSLERLADFYVEQGRKQEAQPLLGRLKELRGQRLPQSLTEGLAKLADEPASASLPDAATQWAWSVADHDRWKWEDWRKGVEWNSRATALVLDWWKWRPERRAEIGAFVHMKNEKLLLDAVATGKGCFLAGAHVGNPAAGIAAVFALNVRLKILGRAGGDGAADSQDEKIIPITENMYRSIRSLVEHLESGGVLGTACDFPIGKAYTTNFLGLDVKLPAFVPKLVRHHAGASFSMQSLWHDDHVVVELEPLPTPVDGESDDAWTRRWFDAYLDHLERVFRGDPRNINLKGGIPATLAPSTKGIGAIAKFRKQAAS
jgi:predicted Zn-dependent protease